MKKKILSVLLITIILLTSLSTFVLPVQAKILEDYEDDWQYYWDENWIGNEESQEIIEFDTVDEYLNATYENYANVNKNEITRLFIEGFNIYDIKDLSGLYDFPNLTELEIYYLANEDVIKTLDLSKIPNLKKLAVYVRDIDINDLGIDKLSNLTHINIYASNHQGIEFNLDLSDFKQLKHFELYIGGTLKSNNKTAEEILNNMKQQIIPIERIRSFRLCRCVWRK